MSALVEDFLPVADSQFANSGWDGAPGTYCGFADILAMVADDDIGIYDFNRVPDSQFANRGWDEAPATSLGSAEILIFNASLDPCPVLRDASFPLVANSEFGAADILPLEQDTQLVWRDWIGVEALALFGAVLIVNSWRLFSCVLVLGKYLARSRKCDNEDAADEYSDLPGTTSSSELYYLSHLRSCAAVAFGHQGSEGGPQEGLYGSGFAVCGLYVNPFLQVLLLLWCKCCSQVMLLSPMKVMIYIVTLFLSIGEGIGECLYSFLHVLLLFWCKCCYEVMLFSPLEIASLVYFSNDDFADVNAYKTVLRIIVLFLGAFEWHVPKTFRCHQLACSFLTALVMHAIWSPTKFLLSSNVRAAGVVLAFIYPTFRADVDPVDDRDSDAWRAPATSDFGADVDPADNPEYDAWRAFAYYDVSHEQEFPFEDEDGSMSDEADDTDDELFQGFHAREVVSEFSESEETEAAISRKPTRNSCFCVGIIIIISLIIIISSIT